MNAKNRGYQKITAAAKALHFDFHGQTVLDIGSSTGGFTEYALERGARQVIAIEKGTHQMQAPLRFDPRVELHEKTDIFTVANSSQADSDTTITIPEPDIILADVSFVSLTKVLAYAATHIAGPHTTFLVMCKPQFEATPAELTRGIVKNSATRRTILGRFETWLKGHQFLILAKRDNQLPGRSGNLERFYLLKKAR